MLDKMLVDYCAPTLAGMKTGSLFAKELDGGLFCELFRADRKLAPMGLRVTALGVRGTRALVYAYRPAYLREDLRREGAAEILCARGYIAWDPDQCLWHLRERLAASRPFPHEIGLFLGYPPEDVRGFIEKKRCKYTGLWKVYGDEEKAVELFTLYRRYTRSFRVLLAKGIPVERLAVPDRKKFRGRADGFPRISCDL